MINIREINVPEINLFLIGINIFQTIIERNMSLDVIQSNRLMPLPETEHDLISDLNSRIVRLLVLIVTLFTESFSFS
jgi:hypothetical protein